MASAGLLEDTRPLLLPISNLIGKERTRVWEFPVVRRRVFLAHAAVAPLPRRVSEAMKRYSDRAANEGQFGHLATHIVAASRARTARLIGGAPDEIAFVTSTSTGVSLIAGGLDWQPGDAVVVSRWDFPANLRPWLALRERGVELHYVPHDPERGIGVAEVAAALTTRTRLVSLSSHHHLSGEPTDLVELGRFLRERGVLFCVDAIQGLGAARIRAEDADFITAGAHKWLLGPQGIGILWVSRTHTNLLKPILNGWKSMEEEGLGAGEMRYRSGAERYEPGTLNIIGIIGLHASLGLLEAVGHAAIEHRLASLRRQLVVGLHRLGYDVLGGDPGGTFITSFRHPTRDLSLLRRQLEQEARPVILSERRDVTGRAVLRVAPHFYNTEAELGLLLEKLA